MGSALAELAMAFSAACTMAADAYELLLRLLSALPAYTTNQQLTGRQTFWCTVQMSRAESNSGHAGWHHLLYKGARKRQQIGHVVDI